MKTPSLLLTLLVMLGACSSAEEPRVPDADANPAPDLSQTPLPAGEAEAMARLAASPRHAEWINISTGPQDSIRAWIVHPERSDNAPVVLVVHEIFGLSHWMRAVADQLAADGFIAIAPDLLTMRNIPAGPDGAPDAERVREEIGSLNRDDIHRQLLAIAEYGMSLPSALPTYGIVGFCWGGTASFEHALRSPSLGASVVYYGSMTDTLSMADVNAPVLGLYGGEDARVNATVPAAERWMQSNGKTFEHEIYPGAGHGFLRAQNGQDGANLSASQAAWPRTISWFRTHLEN